MSNNDRISGDKLEEIIALEGMVDSGKLNLAIASQMGIPLVDLKTQRLDDSVGGLIPESIARRYTVFPIAVKDNDITIAVHDPRDIMAIDDVQLATGKRVSVVLSEKADIINLINRFYDYSDEASQAVEEYSADLKQEIKEFTESEDVSASPVVRLVNTVIIQASKMRASDIHLEPLEHDVRIRYRVDGELREIMKVNKVMYNSMVIRIKVIGGMDISERRKPQDGRVETTVDGKILDLRISILPTVFGEKVVLRLLDRSSTLMTKQELGFSQTNIDRFNQIIAAPEGIILLTGPTGSGKTTTLYAVLAEMNAITKNIITVEDPVEYRLDGINQVQVNIRAGLTFASGLRSILRQDPDIVMVGEIRDTETAQIAFRAAITGHVVLSTLHTNDTVSSLTRLVDMEVPAYLVSTAVVGIVAQRLVKKLCNHCKQPYQTSEAEMALLGITEPVTIYRRKGCNECGQTGYQGRTAIHEVLVMNRHIRDMITQNKSVDEVKDAAMKDGMHTLHQSCAELVLNGKTTIDQLIRVTQAEDD